MIWTDRWLSIRRACNVDYNSLLQGLISTNMTLPSASNDVEWQVNHSSAGKWSGLICAPPFRKDWYGLTGDYPFCIQVIWTDRWLSLLHTSNLDWYVTLPSTTTDMDWYVTPFCKDWSGLTGDSPFCTQVIWTDMLPSLLQRLIWNDRWLFLLHTNDLDLYVLLPSARTDTDWQVTLPSTQK